VDKFFFGFVTIHAFDRRTDGQTDGQAPFLRLDRPAFNLAL